MLVLLVHGLIIGLGLLDHNISNSRSEIYIYILIIKGMKYESYELQTNVLNLTRSILLYIPPNTMYNVMDFFFLLYFAL